MRIHRLSVLKQIKKYAYASKWSILTLVITSLLAIPVALISPRFFQILIDNVMSKKSFAMFHIVVLGLIGVYTARFILDGIDLYCGNKLLNRFTLALRLDVWNKYLKLPFSFFESKEIGDLKMRLIDDVNCLGNFIHDQVVDYLVNFLKIGIFLYLVFTINFRMTLYCLTVFPFVFFINYIIGHGSKKVNEDIRRVNQEYYTSTHNSLQFWNEIKAQGAEHEFIRRFKIFRNILAKLGYRNIRYWLYSEVFNDFKANYLTKVLVYIIGAYFVMDKQITVGILVMFSEYFSMLFIALDSVNNKNVALKVNTPYYQRIFEILGFTEENDEKKKQVAISGDLQIHQLDFKYTAGQQKILDNISLSVRKGDYIAIIGKSGCGKSTLIKLVLGLYSPQNGGIYFSGLNMNELSKAGLYSQIGVVMQDSYLFNMSIRENLLLTKENATDEELIEACRKANIYEFVKRQKNGFDTIIGERGIKISGGQKQRLCIAQALLKKPKIIIFDEATSSLDKLSEDIINQSINDISKDTTVIVVSHKPATVLRAKKVVIIDGGKIIDSSNHEELMDRNEFYRKLAGVN